MSSIFQLGFVIILAAALGVVLRMLKQPVMLAYLATGAIIGYFGFFNLQDTETLKLFSDLGIMFLLFLVGLEINYTSLRIVGRPAIILGISQIIITSGIGFLLARIFGFTQTPALYIATALSFASTIIAVKFLSEKRDMGSLYGKMAVGLLLVQDTAAILILVVLSGLGAGGSVTLMPALSALFKAFFLFGLMLWLGRKALPVVFDRVAHAQELLFLISLAWMFIVVAVAHQFGFSIEIAGLLAGLALANSAEHLQIAHRIRPLRDFFVLVFFAILGSSLVATDIGSVIIPIIVFSLFVLIGNPLIILTIMGIMGYRKRTGFLTGITVSQMSEFSLILGAVGVSLGHILPEHAAVITTAGAVTIILSSYSSMHADKIFSRLSFFLSIFERRHAHDDGVPNEIFEKPLVLIGAHRTGESIARHLPPEDLLIIDFDPEVAEALKHRGIDHLYGDIGDPEILARANLGQARLVISTSPDLNDNLALLAHVNEFSERPKIIVRAETEADAGTLYGAGADYVLLPHITSGQYLGKTLALDPEMRILENLRMGDMETLERENAR
jgi:Kef-type K+ transport system membrane component KefB